MLDKLDVTKLPEKLRAYATEFVGILSNFSAANIDRHRELAHTAPTDFLDSDYFEVPSTFSLVAYGEPGINALYDLVRLDGAGGYWGSLALVAVATGNCKFLIAYIAPADRYLPEGVFVRISEQIQIVCRQPELQAHAKRQLTRLVHSFISDIRQRHRLELLFASTPFAFAEKDVQKPPVAEILIECIAKGVLTISQSVLEELEGLICQNLAEE